MNRHLLNDCKAVPRVPLSEKEIKRRLTVSYPKGCEVEIRIFDCFIEDMENEHLDICHDMSRAINKAGMKEFLQGLDLFAESEIKTYADKLWPRV